VASKIAKLTTLTVLGASSFLPQESKDIGFRRIGVSPSDIDPNATLIGRIIEEEKPLDRNNCKEIIGTPYNSEQERSWYLENCKVVQQAETSSSKLGSFSATHLGESFVGDTMGCAGAGVYLSEDESMLAVSPERYTEWPCGTVLRVTNPQNGQSIVVTRKDSCPGCGAYNLDLSEAGLDKLGGRTGSGKLEGLQVEVLHVPGR
jgi:hypothetical protein